MTTTPITTAQRRAVMEALGLLKGASALDLGRELEAIRNLAALAPEALAGYEAALVEAEADAAVWLSNHDEAVKERDCEIQRADAAEARVKEMEQSQNTDWKDMALSHSKTIARTTKERDEAQEKVKELSGPVDAYVRTRIGELLTAKDACGAEVARLQAQVAERGLAVAGYQRACEQKTLRIASLTAQRDSLVGALRSQRDRWESVDELGRINRGDQTRAIIKVKLSMQKAGAQAAIDTAIDTALASVSASQDPPGEKGGE